MTTVLDTWARGTLQALDRQANGQVVTTVQATTSLAQENARLIEQLRAARERIVDLEAQLSAQHAALSAQHAALVNMTEAAALLDVHPSTISRWVALGHFQTVTSPHRAKPLIVRSSLKRPPQKRRKKG